MSFPKIYDQQSCSWGFESLVHLLCRMRKSREHDDRPTLSKVSNHILIEGITEHESF
jgi:hypothetical protein